MSHRWLPGLPAVVLCLSAVLTVGTALPSHARTSGDDPDDGGDTTAGSEITKEEITVEEEITVTAHRVEVPRSETGSAVTVIDRAEIEARRAGTVAELLRTVPGVEVSRTGPPGGNVSVFLRGGNSSHTLVLVDGVRVNSPAVGAYDFADLTTDGVERVEIVRGPQSALYGSEALGGVVSIFTRRGTDGGVDGHLRAEAGEEEARRLSASLRGGTGPWDWSLAAGGRELRGLSAASETAGNREADPWRNLTLSALAGRDLPGGGRGELAVRWIDSETGLDGFAFGVGPVDDPNYRQQREAATVSLRLETPVTERWTQHLRLGTAVEDLRATDPDTPFHPFRVETRVSDAVLQGDLTLADGGGWSDVLVVGGGVERREADNPAGFDETADVTSGFVENRLGWHDRVFLTVGARRDDHSRFGAETTWRGTLSWRLADWTGGDARLHGSWGTGFKAPTFNELHFPGFGNPDLAPETSESWDLGLDLGFGAGRGRLALTWFDSEIEDLIGFDFVTFRAENVAAADVRGGESRLSWLFGSGVEGRLGYTWTDSQDRATGEPLPRRPEHRASVTVLVDPAGARWDASLTGEAVRDRIDSDGSAMDDYERFELVLGYDLTAALGAYLRVENASDEDAAEVPGFTSPGRRLGGGLRMAF